MTGCYRVRNIRVKREIRKKNKRFAPQFLRIRRSKLKVIALFADQAKGAVICRDLTARGLDAVNMPSIGALLQALKQEDAQAVALEDHALHLLDWLAMLQMRTGNRVPVIVVGNGQGVGMAEALAHGATDYAEHSGCVGPLLARLRARVGLTQPAQANQLMAVGPFELHPASSAVFHDGMEINLTAREFALAWILFSNVGHVVGMSSLAARVWGRSIEVCKRTLEQHIYRLRRKLSINSLDSQIRIQAVYSVGYRLDLRRESRLDWPVPDFGVDPYPPHDALSPTQAGELADARDEGATPIVPDHSD